jgi:hypothetical protein
MVEVLDHQLDDLGLIADIVALDRGFAVALSRFELDDTAVTLLLRVSQRLADTCRRSSYLECTLLEGGFEVVRLTGEDDLVQVEVVWAADEFAV